ncbi:hypothetical protein MSAN_01722000 [Mycena sanguinolenta]|uniref:Ubiquitin-like domain-containing protein n=1 Tax=Mycena sanguinolenta TaxID=230812 RepID=A0A8H6Y013_9AGAR|nr:hypothetical protein MSAN_01722000 [Mycena sanguinolenta]
MTDCRSLRMYILSILDCASPAGVIYVYALVVGYVSRHPSMRPSTNASPALDVGSSGSCVYSTRIALPKSESIWLLCLSSRCGTIYFLRVSHLHFPDPSYPAFLLFPMSFSTASFGDLATAAGLAMRIVQVLYDSPRVLEDYQNAMTELISLHHELVLINDAIQLATSSGTSDLIRQNVAGEVRGCLAEMQHFLDRTKGVAATGMMGVFSKVWWAASEKKELRVLRESVARRRASLSIFLSSSNLIISTATRDEVRVCTETIQELAVALRPVPHPVLEDMVFIIDPLGDTIRISMIYGLKYQDLHRIVEAYYPETRAGRRHITEGAYHFWHPTQGRISQESSVDLKPGTTLEMSMLLREHGNFLELRRTCPRCKQSKSEPISQPGWRKCLRCSKLFQVVTDNLCAQTQEPSMYHLGSGRLQDISKQPEVGDDGVQHFRRVELFCVEEPLVYLQINTVLRARFIRSLNDPTASSNVPWPITSVTKDGVVFKGLRKGVLPWPPVSKALRRVTSLSTLSTSF